MLTSREMLSKCFLTVVTLTTVLTFERLNLRLGTEEVTCIMLATSVVPESLSIVKSLIAYIALEFGIHFFLFFQLFGDSPLVCVIFSHVLVQVLLLVVRAGAMLALMSISGFVAKSKLVSSTLDWAFDFYTIVQRYLYLAGADDSFVWVGLFRAGADDSFVRLGHFLAGANDSFVRFSKFGFLLRFFLKSYRSNCTHFDTVVFVFSRRLC